MVRAHFRIVVVVLLVAGSAFAQELNVDREEVADPALPDIRFESYEGPVVRFDTADAIRGIGRELGRQVAATGRGSWDGRYVMDRVADGDGPLRAADILTLSAGARVDRIDNLRRILAGYLETAWGYSRDDADLIARFLTVYNAVYRGAIETFEARYRPSVVAELDQARVGLAISYREWPGRTQIVIPLRDGRTAGDLDAIDPGQLIESGVIAQLRERPDLGIDDRKAIIGFVERVIEQRTEQIDAEREEIEAEREQLAERREELEAVIAEELEEEPPADPAPADDEAPADTAPADGEATGADEAAEAPVEEPEDEPATAEPATPPDEAADEPEPQPADEAEAEIARIDEREAELDEREAELDQEEAEVEELEQQVEEVYEETAEDQQTAEDGGVPQEIIPVARAIGDGRFELVALNLNSLEVVGEQSIPIVSREYVPFESGVLVVHATSERILLLDPVSLEILREGDTSVPAGARIRVIGDTVLSAVAIDGGTYLGQFSANLELEQRSSEEIFAESDIVQRDDLLIVQRPDGSFTTIDFASAGSTAE